MDERVKKMKIAELEILQMKTAHVVRELEALLPVEVDDSFDDDYSLVLSHQILDMTFKELIEVVRKL